MIIHYFSIFFFSSKLYDSMWMGCFTFCHINKYNHKYEYWLNNSFVNDEHELRLLRGFLLRFKMVHFLSKYFKNKHWGLPGLTYYVLCDGEQLYLVGMSFNFNNALEMPYSFIKKSPFNFFSSFLRGLFFPLFCVIYICINSFSYS